jgi:putative DNA primase/helicase
MTSALRTVPAPSAQGAPTIIAPLACERPPERIDWLWPGWLARGHLHLLAGPAGTGKTTLALSMAATISVGGRWPDGAVAPAGDVVAWSGEDVYTQTISPRLTAMGADVSRVRYLEAMAHRGRVRPLDPAGDCERMLDYLRALDTPPALLIVDPVAAFLVGNSHRNEEVRRSLMPLVQLAAEVGAAVIGITHLAKGTQGADPVERIVGSVAFGALARIVHFVQRRGDQRVLVRAKNNLGPDGDGFSYRTEAVQLEGDIEAACIRWGERLTGDPASLLAEGSGAADAPSAIDDAAAFLETVLRDGPLPSTEVKNRARLEAISDATLRRAKERLRIRVRKLGNGEKAWHWSLPDSDDPAAGRESPD